MHSSPTAAPNTSVQGLVDNVRTATQRAERAKTHLHRAEIAAKEKWANVKTISELLNLLSMRHEATRISTQISTTIPTAS